VQVSNIEVVGLGALNVDNIYRVERILEDGEAVIRDGDSFPGGSAANTICGLARLGVRTGFIGAVGGDADGRTLERNFQKAGVDICQIKTKPRAKTGSTFCLSDELGRRSIYILPGANNQLTLNDIAMDYINGALLLHISSFVDDSQFEVLLEIMTKLRKSMRVSFSPGSLYAARGLRALEPILARTFVLFINHHEIRQLTGEDMNKGTATCLKLGCQIVAVTLGEGASDKNDAACYIRTAEREYMVSTGDRSPTPALDTTGAGDAFAAGFLYGLLYGKSLEECGYLGDIVARFSIARMGARPGLPTFPELAQRYQELYHQPL
jgi:ribokinase